MLAWPELTELTPPANRGDALAQHMLAISYEEGKGVSLDIDTAIVWYRRAAEQGDFASIKRLGVLLLSKGGSDAEAVKWLTLAAGKHDPDALYHLSICYSDGRGVSEDMEKAFTLAQQAAAGGNKKAYDMLAAIGFQVVNAEQAETLRKLMQTQALQYRNRLVEQFYARYGQAKASPSTSAEQAQFTISNGTLTAFCFTGETEVKVPAHVLMIADKAFAGCDKITKVILPDGVQVIGNGAFENCKSLVEINLPRGLKTIGKEAFQNCTSLKAIDIPGVDILGNDAFYGCVSLTAVRIPSGLVNGGDRFGFYSCPRLRSGGKFEVYTQIKIAGR